MELLGVTGQVVGREVPGPADTPKDPRGQSKLGFNVGAKQLCGCQGIPLTTEVPSPVYVTGPTGGQSERGAGDVRRGCGQRAHERSRVRRRGAGAGRPAGRHRRRDLAGGGRTRGGDAPGAGVALAQGKEPPFKNRTPIPFLLSELRMPHVRLCLKSALWLSQAILFLPESFVSLYMSC